MSVDSSDYCVGVSESHHHRAKRHAVPQHLVGLVHRAALALPTLKELSGVSFETRGTFWLHDVPTAGRQAQRLGLRQDLFARTEQHRLGDVFPLQDEGSPQDLLVVALGHDHPSRVFLGAPEDHLEHFLIAIQAHRQAVPIVFQANRTTRDAAGDRRFRNLVRDLGRDSRVERLRDDVTGAEIKVLGRVNPPHGIRHGLLREGGQSTHGGDLHLVVDAGRFHVQRPTEDRRKAQHVVDLIRMVRAAGRDDCVGARLDRQVVANLRIRIRQGEHDRAIAHRPEHLWTQHIGLGQADEDIRALHGLC